MSFGTEMQSQPLIVRKALYYLIAVPILWTLDKAVRLCEWVSGRKLELSKDGTRLVWVKP